MLVEAFWTEALGRREVEVSRALKRNDMATEGKKERTAEREEYIAANLGRGLRPAVGQRKKVGISQIVYWAKVR